MKQIVRLGAVLGLALAIVAIGRSVHGQQPATPSVVEVPSDMNAALLTEVRALRVAIEQMTTASARVQLVMGRLQMQEQRIGDNIKRLDTIRMQVTSVEGMVQSHQDELARFERALETETNPAERNAMEQAQKRLKAALSSSMTQLQRARDEEAGAASAVAIEQGRWSDINQQLEELDRLLRKPQQ